MRGHRSAEGGPRAWSNCSLQTTTLKGARGRTGAHGDDRTRGLRTDALPGRAGNGRARRRQGSGFRMNGRPAGPAPAPEANHSQGWRCRGLPDRCAAAGGRRRSGREGIPRDPHPGPAVGPEPDRCRTPGTPGTPDGRKTPPAGSSHAAAVRPGGIQEAPIPPTGQPLVAERRIPSRGALTPSRSGTARTRAPCSASPTGRGWAVPGSCPRPSPA